MSKDFNISFLLDFYGEMLTEKQRNFIDLYYNQDLSLGEIAEHHKITRQGVRDSIKRGEAFLIELEDKLRLYELHKSSTEIITNIKRAIDNLYAENKMYNYSCDITQNLNYINEQITAFYEKNS